MSDQCLCQDRPSLNLAENAAVFFGTRVKQPHPCAFEILVAIAGLHHFQPVGGVQLVIGRLHDRFRLLRRRAAGNHGPALRVQPHVGFVMLLAADDVTVVPVSTDKPVAFEAFIVQDLEQLRRLFVQILHVLRLIFAEFLHYIKRIVQLESHERTLTL